MKSLFHIVQIWLPSLTGFAALLLLLFAAACRPAETSSASATLPPLPSVAPAKMTPSSPASVTPPTATINTAPTRLASTLSLDGPWLVYGSDLSGMHPELVIVNHDLSGRYAGEEPVCDPSQPISIDEDSSNRMVILLDKIYLIQPRQASIVVVHDPRYSPCGTAFVGSAEGGLLASLVHSGEDPGAELRIYEMPSGKIRDRFPLLRCPDQTDSCGLDQMFEVPVEWSPNGRYLAFRALLEGPSSDLYVYDTQTGLTRRLTSGPDHVGLVWWSPDSEWIIMAEILAEYYPETTSLWAVASDGSDIRMLYSADVGTLPPQAILGWIDDERFLVYEGTSLYNALDLPADNLRLVDLRSGTVDQLFDGPFVAAALDRANQTVALYAYDPHPRPGYQGQGIYLVSTSNTTPRFVGTGEFQPEWNEDLRLFVTRVPCEDDPQGTRAFDYDGEWVCFHRPPPGPYPSPDAHWQISTEDGMWLESDSGESILVSHLAVTQVIWCPDSGCFFFVTDQALFRASLPDHDIDTVDELGTDEIVYQWVDALVQP